MWQLLKDSLWSTTIMLQGEFFYSSFFVKSTWKVSMGGQTLNSSFAKVISYFHSGVFTTLPYISKTEIIIRALIPYLARRISNIVRRISDFVKRILSCWKIDAYMPLIFGGEDVGVRHMLSADSHWWHKDFRRLSSNFRIFDLKTFCSACG